MSIGALLKRLAKAVPAIFAAAPAVIDVVKQVRQAIKKPKPPAEGGDSASGAATIER